MFEQIKNFVKKLTNLQKIIILSSIVVVIVGLILIFNTGKSHDNFGVLFTSLESGDASKIVEKLKEKKIEYDIADNGSTILVDKKNIYEARLSLAAEGLPESSTVGYEIFDKTNLGMSEFVQKLNYIRAKEGELARTISTIEEIKKVRVHIVIPERTLFEKDQKKPTASVTIHLKSGRSYDKINISGIQNLVSSSVEGLAPKDVTIVDQKGKIISERSPEDGTIAGLTSMQYEQKKKVEEYLTGKVQSMLDGVLGSGNSEVRVNAELDFTQMERTKTDFDPDKQVVRSEQNILENSKSEDSLSYPNVKSDKNLSNQISNYEISKTVERVIHEVGSIKRLSVAAMINGTTKIIDRKGEKVVQYIPRTEEQMNQLTEIVKNSIGFDPSRNDQVSVLNVPFDNSYLEEEKQQTEEIQWWQNPDNIKLVILIMAIIGTMLIMYKLLHSRQIKEKVRTALGIADRMSHELEMREANDVDYNNVIYDDDELLLLPAELPEQMLLEGNTQAQKWAAVEEKNMLEKVSMVESGKISFDDIGTLELNEEALLKRELKSKVRDYINNNTNDAVKIVRMMLIQDLEDKPIKLQSPEKL